MHSFIPTNRDDNTYSFNILVIGNEKSGKSTLLDKIRAYEKAYESDSDYIYKTSYFQGIIIKNHIWAANKSLGLRRQNLNWAAAIIVTVDMTDKNSFDDLFKYLQEIDRYAPEVQIVIVGTKKDDKNIVLTENELKKLENNLNHNNLFVMTASGKTGENVHELFDEINNRLLKKHNILYKQVTNKEKQDNIKITELKSIKHIVFDWDDTLSNSIELVDNPNNRTLAFPKETLELFKKLSSLGIKITIASNQTETTVIKTCLQTHNILNITIHGKDSEKDKLAVLNEIYQANLDKNTGNPNISKNQICLVDDSSSCCKMVRENGFSSIKVEDCDTYHVTSQRHLFTSLQHCIVPLNFKFDLNFDLNIAASSIARYKNSGGDHLNFFWKAFDPTRGINRADIYLHLLNQEPHDLFKKLVIVYSSLANHLGETLQEYLFQSMGFINIHQAREYLQAEIKNQLIIMNKGNRDFDLYNYLEQLNEHVIGKIVAIGNSDTKIDAAKSELTEIMSNWRFLDQKFLGALHPTSELDKSSNIKKRN